MRQFEEGIRSVAEEIGHFLLGTCMESIDGQLDEAIEEGKLTVEEAQVYESQILDVIDNITFTCVTCGWWCEAGDWYDNGNGEDECGDCHGDREDV